jgi:hypothetical protein
MLVFYLKAEGPMEQKVMNLIDKLDAVISDTTTLTSEGAQIRATFLEFKEKADALSASNESLKATIEELKAAKGNTISDEQLQTLIAKAEAKNAAIDALFTPDFVGTEPTPPTDPVTPSE